MPSGCQAFHLGKAVVFQASFRGIPVYVKSKYNTFLAKVNDNLGKAVVFQASFRGIPVYVKSKANPSLAKGAY